MNDFTQQMEILREQDKFRQQDIDDRIEDNDMNPTASRLLQEQNEREGYYTDESGPGSDDYDNN